MLEGGVPISEWTEEKAQVWEVQTGYRRIWQLLAGLWLGAGQGGRGKGLVGKLVLQPAWLRAWHTQAFKGQCALFYRTVVCPEGSPDLAEGLSPRGGHS